MLDSRLYQRWARTAGRLLDEQVFGNSQPKLLQGVATRKQHLEKVGKGSRGIASEWVPVSGGGAGNHWTPIRPVNEPTRTAGPCPSLVCMIAYLLAVMMHLEKTPRFIYSNLDFLLLQEVHIDSSCNRARRSNLSRSKCTFHYLLQLSEAIAAHCCCTTNSAPPQKPGKEKHEKKQEISHVLVICYQIWTN